jgi:hypothetical protein
MSFEEFEHQARLYVVGALEHEELGEFENARREFGGRAEACIIECRRLNEVFALTLRPQAPREDAKNRLMSLIQKSLKEKSRVV